MVGARHLQLLLLRATGALHVVGARHLQLLFLRATGALHVVGARHLQLVIGGRALQHAGEAAVAELAL